MDIRIPEPAQRILQDLWGEGLDRAALEALVADGYRCGKLDAAQVRVLLGRPEDWDPTAWLAERLGAGDPRIAELLDDREAINRAAAEINRAGLPPPGCPRCGYDLSGIIASWKSTHPVEGRCSECGFVFLWRDVLSPRYHGPEWSFEHTQRHQLKCLVSTIGRALTPWRLWATPRQVGLAMGFPMQASRLWILAATCLAGLHLLAVIVAFMGRPSGRWGRRSAEDTVLRVVWPYCADIDLPGSYRESLLDFFVLWSFMLPLAASALMLVFAGTLKSQRVLKVHIVRGLCYAIPLAAISALGAHIAHMVAGDTVLLRSAAFNGALYPAVVITGLFALWWWMFLSRYVQIRHAPAVLGAALVVGTLSAATVCVLFAIMFRFDLFAHW